MIKKGTQAGCYLLAVLLLNKNTEFSIVFRSFIQAELFQGTSIFLANPMAHFAVNPRQRVGVANCFDWYVI